jgi:hypothetical protein
LEESSSKCYVLCAGAENRYPYQYCALSVELDSMLMEKVDLRTPKTDPARESARRLLASISSIEYSRAHTVLLYLYLHSKWVGEENRVEGAFLALVCSRPLFW